MKESTAKVQVTEQAQAQEKAQVQTSTSAQITNIDFKALAKKIAVLPQVEKKETVEVNCKVLYDVRTNRRTQQDEYFLAIDMDNPFDEFSPPIRIDIKNRSRRGKFKMFANRMLAELPQGVNEIPFKGKVYLRSFVDKVSRSDIEYVGIEVENIFSDDGMLYTDISSKEDRGAFILLAKNYLKLSKNSDPDIT